MVDEHSWTKAKVAFIILIALLSILFIFLLVSTYKFFKFYKYKSKWLLWFFIMLIWEIIWRITTFSLYLKEYYEDWRRGDHDLADNMYSYSGLAFMSSAFTFHFFSWLYNIIEIKYFLNPRNYLLITDIWLVSSQIIIFGTYSAAFTEIHNLFIC